MAKVLVIDDSELVRNFHSYILRSEKFEVVTANDGVEGLEKFFSDKFDLVIVDLNMPRLDGYEVVRQIRDSEDDEEVPIIVISTEDSEDKKAKGFEAGANVYIVKPTEPEKLVANVRTLIGHK
ncbi:MAG TPA: response regulator [bacterium]|nr:response regulator [bacterium]